MRTVGLWLLLIVCVLVLAYAAYLLIANAAADERLSLYPAPSGKVAAIWVLLAAVVAGAVLVPLLRLLVWTAANLKASRKERAAAEPAEPVGEARRFREEDV